MKNIVSDEIVVNNGNEYRFYVYAWTYPDGRPFYVGKGVGGRDEQPKRNSLFKNIVAKISRDGGKPFVVRWQEGLREEEAFKFERAYIKLFGRRDIGTGILCNLTDGGDGSSGSVRSAETRSKIREMAKGRIHDPETRAKMSAAKRGKARAPFSIATCAKMSEVKRGKTLNPETREKLAKAHRAMPPKFGFKGVTFRNRDQIWVAQIKIGGIQRHLGRFPAPDEAARAYDKAAYEAWGLDCHLNFPSELVAENDNARHKAIAA